MTKSLSHFLNGFNDPDEVIRGVRFLLLESLDNGGLQEKNHVDKRYDQSQKTYPFSAITQQRIRGNLILQIEILKIEEFLTKSRKQMNSVQGEENDPCKIVIP